MAGSVSTLLVRPLVLAVNRRASEFFGATDLTPQLVADDDARISPAQFCVAWAEAMRLTGDPQLGLTIAAATRPARSASSNTSADPRRRSAKRCDNGCVISTCSTMQSRSR